MRENWNTGHLVTASPTNGEHSSSDIPLHSPATPAWNIADRIVKDELPEDKNNDSGVSPGHYTSNSVSPRSRRSSSTANGSLSPGSASSQDSSAMQYEYSPQSIYKSCVSPLGFGGHDTNTNGNQSPKLQSAAAVTYTNDIIDSHHHHHRHLIHHNNHHQGSMNDLQNEQPIDMVSSTMKQDSDDSDANNASVSTPSAILQCPICSFNTVHRTQFNEHLASHCSPKQCDTTDYSTSSYTQSGPLSEDGARGSPSQGDRSEHEYDDIDEPGLRVPRVNCQGKVKTFKCKQCHFTAVTKLAFWEHSRGHIKAEKLLTCPKCPFVTEYKHHLEYHLRNHFNSKPFKCDKCPYSCVNKSMLNSHLKSHSNVYQYRCAECSYATKYCHSLKLHLRKYGHKPAMVLNPDGSPNPLPIIDIYGTRRGPKQKSAPKTTDDVNPSSLLVGSSNTTPISVAKMSAIQSPSLFSNEPNLAGRHQGTQLNVPFSYAQIYDAVTSLPGGPFFQQYHESNHHCNNDDNGKQLFDVFSTFNGSQEIKMGGNDFCAAVQKESIITNSSRLSPPINLASSTNDLEPKLTEFGSPDNEAIDCAEDTMKEISSSEVVSTVSPLDLSKSEVTLKSTNTNSPSRAGGKSRRKGRAFKLDRLIVEQDSEDDENNIISPIIINDQTTTSDNKKEFHFNFQHSTIQQNNHKDEITSGGTSDYNCQYCDIAFGNVVMYTMHMGYHGYKNPYTCNMCGQQCDDKVSFFLHIARDSHS